MKKIKLFCVPYSGGSATVYYKWKKELDQKIEICPIELAGRGRRINEKPFDCVNNSADDIAEQIAEQISDESNYAIWGHSLGSVLALEAGLKLIKKGLHPPCHMFFSGRRAPQDVLKTSYYKLPDKEFLMAVMKYGENSGILLENKELRELFLPILRADFKMGETYNGSNSNELIKCNITIVNGSEDSSVMNADMHDWQGCTEKECDVYLMQGGHFFLFDNSKPVIELINNKLADYC